MLELILSWFGGGPFSRILDSIDNKVDNETSRETLKSNVTESYILAQSKKVNAQAQLLEKRTWWFQLFFVVPLGMWFASVILYSMFWCSQCAYPQPWIIAALPPPLDTWSGGIISSLFLLEVGSNVVSRFIKR